MRYMRLAVAFATVAGLFALYALSGPLLTASNRIFGWPAWAVHEDEDEEELPLPDPDAESPDDHPPEAGPPAEVPSPTGTEDPAEPGR